MDGTPATPSGRMHLLIALIAFLALELLWLLLVGLRLARGPALEPAADLAG
jgi:hypothetical protein